MLGDYMRKRECLYDDFYEGAVHIIIQMPPILIAVVNTVIQKIGDCKDEISLIPISLSISIISSIYAARNFYKDAAYICSKRVKIEFMKKLSK